MTRRANFKRKRILGFSEALEPRRLLAGDLTGHWVAQDLLDGLEAGARVTAWTDRVGGAVAAPEDAGNPTLLNGVVGGRPAVHFDASDGADPLFVPAASSPMTGAGDFTVGRRVRDFDKQPSVRRCQLV